MKRLIGKATQARNSGGNALEQSADSAAEVPLEDAVEQLSTVLARVAKGDLGARAVLQQGPPEARKLGHDLNTVLDLFESYMRETDATVRAAAEGRLHRVVLQRGMPGQFASGARGVNEVRAALVEAEADRERRTSVRMAMADEVSHAAEGLAEVADRLGGSAGAMTESAKTAAQASSAAGATVEELRTASMQIEAAVHVVAQVANQTRLLALNASIEAARAGEAGKGFAVVAGEVKNLADETAASTDGIRTQVLRAQHAANQAATALAALGQAVETMNDRIGDVTADLGQDGLAGLSSNLQARIHELNK